MGTVGEYTRSPPPRPSVWTLLRKRQLRAIPRLSLRACMRVWVCCVRQNTQTNTEPNTVQSGLAGTAQDKAQPSTSRWMREGPPLFCMETRSNFKNRFRVMKKQNKICAVTCETICHQSGSFQHTQQAVVPKKEQTVCGGRPAKGCEFVIV